METHGHSTPQTSCSKFQWTVEAAFDLLGVIGDGLQFGLLRRSEGITVQPFLKFLAKIHMRFLLFLQLVVTL